MSIHRTEIISQQLDYVEKIFTKSDPILDKIVDELTPNERRMQISAIEARLLQVIIALNKPKKIVELGVLAGYSALNMAKVLEKNSKIYAIDIDSRAIIRAEKYAKLAKLEHLVNFYQGPALEVLEKIKSEGPFDMIFIDADKANYANYLTWAEENLKSGGVIVGDNTFLFGDVYQEKCPENQSVKAYNSMREFNQRLSDPNKYISILIPTVEGMTVAVKK